MLSRDDIANIVYCNVPANYDGSNPEQVKEVCEKVADKILALLEKTCLQCSPNQIPKQEKEYCSCPTHKFLSYEGIKECATCHKPLKPIPQPKGIEPIDWSEKTIHIGGNNIQQDNLYEFVIELKDKINEIIKRMGEER